jgi:RNA polymerase sigma-70 factor (ECF subfamily)
MDSSISGKPARLLLAARQGDERALGELLEHFRSYLELLARMEIGRRLQTKIDTADVVQDTYLDAHRSFKSFRGSSEKEFVAWLRSIFATRLSMLLRHYLGTQGRDLRREQGLEINLDQTSQLLERGLFAAGNTPSQSVMQREQGVILAEALARLPEDYREIVMLRHLEDLPFADAAARMNRSVDSVQKLWVRALARLKSLMADRE